mmetsp:Transcript_1928/g.4751  ORF Transcript_1928/g.4751 Transcript_1928/m.4751 type:complete len:234 (-) Transcript_1928:687-1388(-)
MRLQEASVGFVHAKFHRQFCHRLARSLAHHVVVSIAHFHVVSADRSDVVSHDLQAGFRKDQPPRLVAVQFHSLRKVEAVEAHPRQEGGEEQLQIFARGLDGVNQVREEYTVEDAGSHPHLGPVVGKSGFQDGGRSLAEQGFWVHELIMVFARRTSKHHHLLEHRYCRRANMPIEVNIRRVFAILQQRCVGCAVCHLVIKVARSHRRQPAGQALPVGLQRPPSGRIVERPGTRL